MGCGGKKKISSFQSSLQVLLSPACHQYWLRRACQATRHQTIYNNMVRGRQNTSVIPRQLGTRVEYVQIHTALYYILNARQTAKSKLIVLTFPPNAAMRAGHNLPCFMYRGGGMNYNTYRSIDFYSLFPLADLRNYFRKLSDINGKTNVCAVTNF